MVRTDPFNLHVYHLGTEMTAKKQIPILQVFLRKKSEVEDFLVKKTLLQVCYKEKDESKGIIVYESSTEEGEP